MLNDIFETYFLKPFIEHTGYNLINTSVYAFIAIAFIYLFYKFIKRKGIVLKNRFIYSLVLFILFGSTLRALTDSIDTHVFKPITFVHSLVLNSHLYDYGFFTVTPGIYILVAFLFLFSYFVMDKYFPYFSLVFPFILFFFHFLLILPFMKYIQYSVPVLILALIPSLFSYIYLKNSAFIVFAHALDGAATFFVLDIFSKLHNKPYFEQHPIPRAIGTFFGTFFAFYLIKVLVSFFVAYFINKEKDKTDKILMLSILITIGLAPGIRDLLRMGMGA